MLTFWLAGFDPPAVALKLRLVEPRESAGPAPSVRVTLMLCGLPVAPVAET
jgi:hypothetical protein